ncbi:MAG: protein translocase subunit SecD [Proteobacteria bacterium]|nr:protein translocase subunit SecD [Pseudomonadota bacterium]
MTRYPLWKYILILVVCAMGILYAFPNLYGDDPGIQMRGARGLSIERSLTGDIEKVLQENDIVATGIHYVDNSVDVQFADNDTQLRAREVLNKEFGKEHTIALTLLSAAPQWLTGMGLSPMNLGLDLRGGVHFLLEVDIQSAVDKARARALLDIKTELRKSGVRYKSVKANTAGQIEVVLRQAGQLDQARRVIAKNLNELNALSIEGQTSQFLVEIKPAEVENIKKFAIDQNMIALRNRIDQLGVAEPIVQQQGDNRIVIQLPGVQDPARAKLILGRAATLEMRMVDEKRNSSAISSGVAPPGSSLYQHRDGRSILLKDELIYSGDNIVDAQASIDTENGGPIVNITLDAKGARTNQRVTGDNIGNRMAVVYLETVTETRKDENGSVILNEQGEPERLTHKIQEVITAPVIRDQLGKRFQISGLDGINEARDLSLMLRAGALAAPVEIIEERTIGPSLGKDNIAQGFKSVMIGLALVLVFMVVYYRVFGLVANVALVLNLVLLVAVLSMLQATLSLPGVAGIVLTVGMAVDANVLIFERIREELRNGVSAQKSIDQGYARAFSTILDANVTTLIAAVVLFAFGTGPIKGFAVTLSIGILTSMFTAIVVSRGIIYLIYGRRRVDKIAI